MKTLRGLHKIFGGKQRIRRWLYENFPENYTELDYVEPCAAAGSVFFGKKQSQQEFISDINPFQINLWKIVQNEITVRALIKLLNRVNYTERTFLKHCKIINDYQGGGDLDQKVKLAASWFIKQQMSRSGRGDAFAFCERQRGGQPGDINAFESCVAQLLSAHERIKNTSILCDDVETVIENLGNPNTFIYIDPPYVKKSRVSTDVYLYEMEDKKHRGIAKALKRSGAKFMISGYDSELYEEIFAGCRVVRKTVANNSGESTTKKKRIECLWMNY